MKKIIEFLKASNHWKHLLYGYLIAIGANDWYCAEYVTVGVASALEFKDKQHGCEWDWVDWSLTFVGGNLGYLTRFLIFG